MTTTLVPAVACLALTLTATACDLALLPESATYEGEGTPRLEVLVRADRMPDSEVDAVDLEIAELTVHRVEDDTWVWIGGSDERVALSLTQTDAQAQVPLHPGTYDRVALVVDAPRVATDGSWHAIALASDALELAIDLALLDDARLEIVFDIDASLTLAEGAWRFDPHVDVDAIAL